MTKIGLLSDTHGFFDPALKDFFAQCDEIWHAGDIGDLKTADVIKSFKLLRAVHGNIDDATVRREHPMHLRFMCEQVDVWITHIGGYPDNYSIHVKDEIIKHPPRLFISGHSHILKVIYDKKLELLHINPGAAGKTGLHHVRTAVRFAIDLAEIKDLEIIELQPRR